MLPYLVLDLVNNVDRDGLVRVCRMLLSDRICKDEVISDYEAQVKNIKEVKLFSSRTPGLLQQTESFLMVRLTAQRPLYSGYVSCYVSCFFA